MANALKHQFSHGPAYPTKWVSRNFLNCAVGLVAVFFQTACAPVDEPEKLDSTAATFAGSQQCADCHNAQYADWAGSNHHLAMQVANAKSVLGNFDNQTIAHFGKETTFSSRAERFFVTTQDAQGNDRQFEVTHTFGVDPLQQYLVATTDGKKQALQIAWDTRPPDEGGQRWFHLYPDEDIPSDDPLHWTGRYFNWNAMCAECHSTNVRTNYSIASDAFDTSFDEISVGCEACHGPGSRHVTQAKSGQFQPDLGLVHRFSERSDVTWRMNQVTGIATRSTPNVRHQETESCGRCHARRSTTVADYEYAVPLTQTHMPALLEDGLYYADGRILDEVYVYGSFLQSKMYAAGVTCSDCHNSHSGELHAGPNPNDTCAQCHLKEKFASPDHSESSVGECVTCHMPATTYMRIDPRRDHSFRLPGTSDDPSHYGTAIAAGRSTNANAQLLDAAMNNRYPPIASATALSLVGPVENAAQARSLIAQLESPSPLQRIAALRALRRQSPGLRLESGFDLLADKNRAVRIEAAQTYVDILDALPVQFAEAFAISAADYRSFMQLNAYMPEAALRLAEFESQLGNIEAAADLYVHALRIGHDFAPSHYAYGLHLVRTGKREEALPLLERAVQLNRDEPRYAYVYGVALHSIGRSAEAVRALQTARARFPGHFDIAWALVTVARDSGEHQLVSELLQEMLIEFPGNTQLRAMMNSIVQDRQTDIE